MGMDEYLRKAKKSIELGKQINHRFVPWIDISHTESRIGEKRGWKIHVSVHPEDYDRMAPIIAKIMEYRDRHGIGAKFATKGWAEEMMNHETQRGKTITIYVPEEKAAIAPEIIKEIERIIEREGIRTHHPAPNDEIVGKTGAVGVAYTHFGGEHIEVPEGFKHVYGEKISDHARRNDPRLAVPPWKEREFHRLFGKIPLNVAVLKALKAMGYSDKEAFEKMRALNLRKTEHRTAGDRMELRPGTVVTVKDAGPYRIKNPEDARSGTLVAPFVLIHGGWQSGLSAPAYVLNSKGYVKIEAEKTKLREARESVKHLHEEPHVVVEKLPGVLRIYNVGKKALQLERVG